jgi:hypothetical protein
VNRGPIWAIMAAMAKGSWSLRRWALIGLLAMLAWQGATYFLDRKVARPEKLINQLWIERIPQGPRDMVWYLAAIEHDDHRLGVLGRSSRWRVFSDGFLWKQEGEQFSYVTPQNGCRGTVKARTWKCAGEAPKPFELCLELESEGKRYRYYSRNDWEIRPGGQLAPELGFAAPLVQAALAMPAIEPEPAPAEASATCEPLGPPAP